MSSSSPASSSTRSKVLGAAAVVAGVAALVWLWKATQEDDDEEYDDDEEGEEFVPPVKAPKPSTSASSASSASASASSASPSTAVSAANGEVRREDVIAIFNDLHDNVAQMLITLRQEVDAGRVGPEKMMILSQQGMQEINNAVLAKYGFSPQMLQQATQAYGEDTEVKAAMARLTSLFAPDVDTSAVTMTSDEFLEKLRLEMQYTEEICDALVEEVKASGLSGEEAGKTYQDKLLGRLHQERPGILVKMGVEPESYQLAQAKYVEEDPRTMEILMRAQASQKARMERIMAL